MSTTVAVAPGVPASPDRLHRIDQETYHEMGRTGLIRKADRVVLLDGILVTKMTKGSRHVYAMQGVYEGLHDLRLPGFHPRPEAPVAFYNGPGGADSEPEPDVVLVRGVRADYVDRLPGPTDVVLAVEVADSSLADDRAGLARYAWFGIPCVWIVNLRNDTVEVYQTPTGVGSADARYGKSDLKGPDDTLEVVVDGNVLGRLAVREILPSAR